ncbi:hypothetical protein M0R72_19425 [Candidatus Pacearchaeota archaeon]|jgi:hypothetical protein|nr:hypothetical protein [Candidatus Pacearchaeota archaeon]
MGCLSLVSAIILACLPGAADEFINEEPPLYVEGDLLDVSEDATSPVIAEEEKPLVFPEEMPAAAQIIVEANEDLSDINFTDINWTEFYADFAPIEFNMTDYDHMAA